MISCSAVGEKLRVSLSVILLVPPVVAMDNLCTTRKSISSLPQIDRPPAMLQAISIELNVR